MIIPISINSQKKIIFTHHSYLAKCFALLPLKCWIILVQNLPPSSAGIGKMLKKASAKEIIAPNPRNINRPPWSKSFSPNLIAPTGPVSCLSAFWEDHFSVEKSFPKMPPKAFIVIFRSPFISLREARSDLWKGILMIKFGIS